MEAKIQQFMAADPVYQGMIRITDPETIRLRLASRYSHYDVCYLSCCRMDSQ